MEWGVGKEKSKTSKGWVEEIGRKRVNAIYVKGEEIFKKLPNRPT